MQATIKLTFPFLMHKKGMWCEILAGHLKKVLNELSVAFERYAAGAQFVIPESCIDPLEINHLLVAMRLKRIYPGLPGSEPLMPLQPKSHPTAQPLTPTPSHAPPWHPVTQPLTPRSMAEPSDRVAANGAATNGAGIPSSPNIKAIVNGTK